MSIWTYVKGVVTVIPSGSGPHAKRFVLEEVLDHLPRVVGSEGDMEWGIMQLGGPNSWSSRDEFNMYTNLRGREGWEEDETYLVVLNGCLRDTEFSVTLRQFTKWLCRLAKRVSVRDVLVRVSGHERDYSYKEHVFDDSNDWSMLDCYTGAREEGMDSWEGTRLSTDWRYDLDATNPFWPHKLVNLVPGGHTLASDRDMLKGQLEWYEYCRWDKERGEHTCVDPETKGWLLARREELDRVLALLDERDAEYPG